MTNSGRSGFFAPASLARLGKLFDAIRYELYLSYRFVWRDLSASVIPTTLFTIAALKVRAQGNITDWVMAIVHTLVYCWLYIYAFCIANQLSGLEEDRVNKPDRPLSSGLVSYRGAQLRWLTVMLLFSLLGWWFGSLKWALLWQACIVLHNFYGWAKHWVPKNLIIMPTGLIAMLAPAWESVTPLTPLIWRWFIILAVVIGVTINLQDLRDITGDIRAGRKTMPISWGERPTRYFLSVCYILLALSIHYGLMMPLGLKPKVIVCDAFLALMNFTVAIRVLIYRTPNSDHKTYMLYTYWFCGIMISAIIVL